MSGTAHTASAAVQAPASAVPGPLQRTCNCGGAAGPSGQCTKCSVDEKLGIQPKLTIGPQNDVYEQEADRIADQVVTGGPGVSKVSSGITQLQRQSAETEEETGLMQPKATVSEPAATKTATAAAAAVAAGGQPLSHPERTFFESRFGRDLSNVRIHTDATAQSAARGINARAYTLRNHIVFAPGQHSPGTTEGRRLLAHELTHTLQQGTGFGAVQRIQRATPYYALDSIRGEASPGTRTHRHVQHNLGIEARSGQTLFAEMPVPGGSERGNRGYVDLYRSDTNVPVGVEFSGGDPEFLHIRRRSQGARRETGQQINGAPLTRAANVRSAAPAGRRGASACSRLGLPRNRGICRLGNTAPTTIEIGEIKPRLSGDSILGTDQVRRYTGAVDRLSTQVTDYATTNPTLVHPSGSTGWSPTVTPLTNLPLGILSPSRQGRGPVDAGLYLGGIRVGPAEPCMLHVEEMGAGIYTYFFEPTSRSGAGGRTSGGGGGTSGGGRTATIRGSDTALRPVRTALMEGPNATQAESSARRVRRGRGGRIRARDSFVFSNWSSRVFTPWRRNAERATGGRGNRALRSPTTEARRRYRNEALRQIDLVRGAGSRLAPAGTREDTRELNRVQHWIDHGTVYGRLRATFGRSFITLIRTFDRLRARIAERTRRTGRNLRGGRLGSGLRGAVLTAIKGLAITMLGIFVRDVAGRLMRAVQQGADAFLRETFEAQLETLDSRITELEQIQEALRTGISERLESEFGEQLALVEQLLEDVETAASTLGAFGTVLELAKWAYRVAQCGVPPVVGCIIGFIASEIAAQAIGLIVASCWFKREVLFPAVSGIEAIARLPGRVARAIGDQARSVLPPSLQAIIGEVDESPIVATPEMVECDNDSSNPYNLTPEQIRLASILSRYDEEHVNSLFDALQHLGIASDDDDPNLQLSNSDVDFIQRLLETYSEEDFERMIEQTEPRRPRSTTTGAVLNELDQAVERAARGESTSGAGGATAETDVGVPSEEEQTEEIAGERAEVQRRLSRVDPSSAQRDRRNFTSGDWTGREVGDTFIQFIFGLREDGTLVGAFERISITGVRDDGQFEINLQGGVRYYADSGETYWTFADDRSAVTIGVTGGEGSTP